MGDSFGDFSSIIDPSDGGEMVFGLVSPIGTNQDAVIDSLTVQLESYGYSVEIISISNLILDLLDRKPSEEGEFKRIRDLQLGGNYLREKGQADVLACAACREISKRRDSRGKRAYILRTLKHPSEVSLLRLVYGQGFYLIAVHMPHQYRLQGLMNKGISNREALELIEIDEKEPHLAGQNTRDAYELADFFVLGSDKVAVNQETERFVSLIFGEMYASPTFEEFGMHMAYSAAVRSSDLSRQVGAALFNSARELIAIGCNEVPKFGGGAYWPDEEGEQRDFQVGYDPNERLKKERFDALFDRMAALAEENSQNPPLRSDFDSALKYSGLKDLTEFGRTVHAEMDALMSCARRGETTRDSILFATTFPCHNCARHIISAGVKILYYIEPYTKSQAYRLHLDSLECPSLPKPEIGPREQGARVKFLHFTGIAPRRFSDFFGMRHKETGVRLERKLHDGRKVDLGPRQQRLPRTPLSSLNYVAREGKAIEVLEEMLTSEE